MPRTAVPPDLDDALDTVPGARERFDALPPERSASLVGWIEEAQLPQTRRRRVAETVRRLVAPTAAETTVVAAPPRSHGLVWLIFGALLAGLAALILWHFYGSRHAAPPATRVVVVTAKTTVPHVVGIKIQAARFQLREAKLGAISVPRISRQPVGLVLGQKPPAGRRVKAGTIVTLVVSKGRPHATMPRVVGLKAPAAVKVLQGVKLVGQLHAVSSSQPAGTVIGQSPRAGGAVAPRSHVVLEISRGPSSTTTAATSTVTVTATTSGAATTAAQSAPPAPSGSTGHDYRGLTLAQVIPRLGREQAIVVYAASSRPAGVIVSDGPVGSRERLTVSAGPSPAPAVQVPDVTGEDASQAQSDLRRAGLTAVTVQWPVGDQSNDGMVVYESPAAGGNAPRGATVVVYVGSFSG
jgi:beta-lactam-binding protein with PASTA domain